MSESEKTAAAEQDYIQWLVAVTDYRFIYPGALHELHARGMTPEQAGEYATAHELYSRPKLGRPRARVPLAESQRGMAVAVMKECLKQLGRNLDPAARKYIEETKAAVEAIISKPR